MTAAVAFPYRLIPSQLVDLDPWGRLDAHGVLEPLGENWPGWDYDSNIELTRSVKLTVPEIFKSIGLARDEAEFALIVTAETGPTGCRWVVARANVDETDRWQHEVVVSLRSRELAHRLSLFTEIVLSKPVRNRRPFVPSQIGSRLFRDTKTVQLEGTQGRFPMEMLDFSKSLPYLAAGNGLWYLDWDPNRPEANFLGSVLLYINSARREVADLVQAADPTLLTLLRCDVMRTMCQNMLNNEEFLAEFDAFGNETVGGQVREWLLIAFDDINPDVLKNMLNSTPGRFEVRIQDAFS